MWWKSYIAFESAFPRTLLSAPCENVSLSLVDVGIQKLILKYNLPQQ